MNNLTKNKTVRCLAFISTVAVYYFGTSLIIAILIQVIHARITHPASHSTLFYVATLVEWLTLLILIIIAAFRNGYHWKSYRNIDLAEHRALVKKKAACH